MVYNPFGYDPEVEAAYTKQAAATIAAPNLFRSEPLAQIDFVSRYVDETLDPYIEEELIAQGYRKGPSGWIPPAGSNLTEADFREGIRRIRERYSNQANAVLTIRGQAQQGQEEYNYRENLFRPPDVRSSVTRYAVPEQLLGLGRPELEKPIEFFTPEAPVYEPLNGDEWAQREIGPLKTVSDALATALGTAGRGLDIGVEAAARGLSRGHVGAPDIFEPAGKFVGGTIVPTTPFEIWLAANLTLVPGVGEVRGVTTALGTAAESGGKAALRSMFGIGAGETVESAAKKIALDKASGGFRIRRALEALGYGRVAAGAADYIQPDRLPEIGVRVVLADGAEGRVVSETLGSDEMTVRLFDGTMRHAPKTSLSVIDEAAPIPVRGTSIAPAADRPGRLEEAVAGEPPTPLVPRHAKVLEALAAHRAVNPQEKLYLRWDEVNYSPGDKLPPSRQWTDAGPTARVYKGTSVLDPSYTKWSQGDLESSYMGDLYLVRGRVIGRGSDTGEVFLRDPEVVQKLSGAAPNQVAPPAPARLDPVGNIQGVAKGVTDPPTPPDLEAMWNQSIEMLSKDREAARVAFAAKAAESLSKLPDTASVAEMRQALLDAGRSAEGTPSKIISRYRDLRAGVTGSATPSEFVSMEARLAYEKALEQTGDPEVARLAGRKAAGSVQRSNQRAGALSRAMQAAQDAVARGEDGAVHLQAFAAAPPPDFDTVLQHFTEMTDGVIDKTSSSTLARAYEFARPATRHFSGDVADSAAAEIIGREAELRAVLSRTDLMKGEDPEELDAFVKAWREERLTRHFPDEAARSRARGTIKDALRPAGTGSEWFTTVQETARQSMLSFDFSVLGQQLEAAVRRGSVPTITGVLRDTVNRIASRMNMPGVLEVYLRNDIDHVSQAIADGLQMMGARSADIDVARRTVFGRIPGVGKPLEALLDNMAEIQYGAILGTVRLRAYEGLLIQNRIIHGLTFGKLGGDISDPLVRRHIAEMSNMIGSASRTATGRQRALWEKRGLLTARMTRAQVSEVLTPLRSFRSQEDALNTLNLIGSVAVALGAAKALNDQFGIGDFIFNPLEAGFGQIVLDIKDSKDRNRVIDIFPQASFPKALLGSIGDLKRGDMERLLDRWQRFGFGRLNIVPQGIPRLAGYGYDAEGQFYGARSGPDERMSLGQAAISTVPLPISFRQAGAEAVRGEFDPIGTGFDFTGQTSFPESPWPATDRSLMQDIEAGLLPQTYLDLEGVSRPLTSYNQLTKEQKQAFDARHGDLAKQRSARAAEPIARIREEQSVYAERQAQIDTLPFGEEWREARQTNKAEQRGALDAIERQYRDYFADLDKKENVTLEQRAIGDYIEAIETSSTRGIVDWDKVDREIAAWDSAKRDALFSLKLAGATEKEKVYIQDIAKLLPYWDVRDQEWEAIRKANPELFGAYAKFEDYRESEIEEVMAANPGVPRSMIEPLVDKMLASISRGSSLAATAYLVEHPELVPLLEKHRYYVPALVRPLAVPAGTGTR